MTTEGPLALVTITLSLAVNLTEWNAVVTPGRTFGPDDFDEPETNGTRFVDAITQHAVNGGRQVLGVVVMSVETQVVR